MSRFAVEIIVSTFTRKKKIMNLHEECLLKYLLNPLDLLHSTELLKINNNLIEKGLRGEKFLAKNPNINYTRI